EAAERPAPDLRARSRPRAREVAAAGPFGWLPSLLRRAPAGAAPAKSGGRKRAAQRRKPQPVWLKPVLVGGLAALCLAGSGGCGWWLWHSGRVATALADAHAALARAMIDAGLTVQEIDVEGRHATSAEDLLQAVGVKRGDPILFFDADAARERIEKIGWVKTAAVQRILPGTILLRIVERQPFARWQIDGRTVLIDHDGKVLEEHVPEEYRELRRVVGPGAADHAGELFDMLMAEPALFGRVRDAVRVRDRRWDIELDNGMTVRLPEQGADVAWRHLAIMDREQKLLDKALVSIDLRLPDRTVVRLTPEAAAARRPMAKLTGRST
ncbi:MAG TPA: FtsQ-type POTRA domain-containing protein, partial [Candidatus Sulfotelmatobacter sp.]|nr:FtsQ-type POTRA domain-containing protein [Candidatus Sulfotelmatobacter sp.]